MKTNPLSYLCILILMVVFGKARFVMRFFDSVYSENSVSSGGLPDLAIHPAFQLLRNNPTKAGFVRDPLGDFEVATFKPDVMPPVIQSAIALSANTVDVLFNGPLDIASSQLAGNYAANNALGAAASAILDATNTALVHLTFAGSITSGIDYQLTVNGVKDLAGNGGVNGTATFNYFAPYIARRYDVLIDEIMADPGPQVGLPNNEWIELKNISLAAINLYGWRIGDAAGQSGPMPDFILLPDSFVIVCAGSDVSGMAAFGTTISVAGFPSLDNTADQLYLKSPLGNIIHSVSYTDRWYQYPLKREGGWTLEMTDTKNPCGAISNWKASTDTKGGTPGRKNAVDAVNADKTAPAFLRAYTIDSLNIILVFDEPLDSLKAVTPANFSISDGIGIPTGAVSISPTFDKIILKLSTALSHNKVYTVKVSGITDCVGNGIGNSNTARAGLPEVAAFSDIAINEILFNPPPGGTDYVEIYNRGNKIIDLGQIYIANRSSGGVISSIARLSAESYLLFPQDFMVIAASAEIVKAAYITRNRDAFIEIADMPSFNDDRGTVLLLNAQGDVTDELKYDEKWHFQLIDNREGVALERIDYNAPTQSRDNWHSAATAAGYGTPTYKNSQYRINDGVRGELKLLPEIVSPDNDGQDDFATLEYHFPDPGYVANITIFNASGRPVRYLQRNALCGTTGIFRWDGLADRGQQLAVGVYVVFTEVFNLKGNRQQFKNVIVLARRGPF